MGIASYRYDVMPEWFKIAMKSGTTTHGLIAYINRDLAWVNAATMVLGCLLTDVIDIRKSGDAGQRVLAVMSLWLGDDYLERVAKSGSWTPDTSA